MDEIKSSLLLITVMSGIFFVIDSRRTAAVFSTEGNPSQVLKEKTFSMEWFFF